MKSKSKALKKLVYLPLVSVMLVSCDKEDDLSNPVITPEINSIGVDVESVTGWLRHEDGLRITLLMDDEDNETYLFAPYLFKFHDNGTVTADKSTDRANGTFSVFRDDGKVELKMNFPNHPGFLELNDDWYFTSVSDGSIRFDDTGEVLVFEKQ